MRRKWRRYDYSNRHYWSGFFAQCLQNIISAIGIYFALFCALAIWCKNADKIESFYEKTIKKIKKLLKTK